MREGNRTVLLSACLLLLGLLWMIAREAHFSSWVDDDAFITLRYARNWAQGNGLVFNPGEFVEGYTNFLWTAFMAVASKLGIDLPTAAQTLGGAFSVLTVLLLLDFRNTGLLPRQEHMAGGGIILASLALCLADSWAAWAVGGLENVFSGFLVAAGFLPSISMFKGDIHSMIEKSLSDRLIICLSNRTTTSKNDCISCL